MADSIDALFKYLPLRISLAVHSLPSDIFESANEIRLRRNAPISVTVGRNNITFNEKGRICGVSGAMRATDKEIAECLSLLTGGSMYTCDEYVASGFIPLSEGGRAGVCGRADMRSGRITGFTEIYSVNLRLHRFIRELASPLIQKYREEGVCGAIICSPPALGKTTFLRSAAYLLATGNGIDCRRVGIADERCEISVGIKAQGLIDIISGAPKADAINILTRTMSPEIIICDEISATEVESVLEAQNTGVTLIASAHCTDIKGLYKRGRMKTLIDAGIFPLCAVLSYDSEYRCEIMKTEEQL